MGGRSGGGRGGGGRQINPGASNARGGHPKDFNAPAVPMQGLCGRRSPRIWSRDGTDALFRRAPPPDERVPFAGWGRTGRVCRLRGIKCVFPSPPSFPPSLREPPVFPTSPNHYSPALAAADPTTSVAASKHRAVVVARRAIAEGRRGGSGKNKGASSLEILRPGSPARGLSDPAVTPPTRQQRRPLPCDEARRVAAALRRAFSRVDDLVLATARRSRGLTRDGATALACLRVGGELYAAHAGDSRAVLCRDGRALRLTEDHKPGLPRERARVEAAGGRVDFQRCWRVVVEPRDGRPGSGLAVSR
jgi:hypothetical protein